MSNDTTEQGAVDGPGRRWRAGALPPSGRSPVVPPVRTVAVVLAGGAVGTLARYGMGQRFPVGTTTFPRTTLVENLIGAALLGLLLYALAGRDAPLWVRPLLATGVLGSFTTFSTFSTEVVLLVRDGESAVAATYAAATLVLGIAAAAAGAAVAHCWVRQRRR